MSEVAGGTCDVSEVAGGTYVLRKQLRGVRKIKTRVQGNNRSCFPIVELEVAIT